MNPVQKAVVGGLVGSGLVLGGLAAYLCHATNAAYNDSRTNYSYEMVPWSIGSKGQKIEGKDRICAISYPLFFPDIGFGIPIGYVDVRFSQINPPRMNVLSIERKLDYYSWKDKLEINLYEMDTHPNSELIYNRVVVFHNNSRREPISNIEDDPALASIVRKAQKHTKDYYETRCKPHLEQRVKSL